MAAGLIDFAALAERLVPAALRHIALMGTAWLLYAIALVWRSDGFAPGDGPILLPALCGFAGAIALLGGAWQGGDLVFTAFSGSHQDRSEEHTSELQSLMRISYAVFCLKKKNI